MDIFERAYLRAIEILIKRDASGKIATLFGIVVFLCLGAAALALVYLGFYLVTELKFRLLGFIILFVGGAFGLGFIVALIIGTAEMLATAFKSIFPETAFVQMKAIGRTILFLIPFVWISIGVIVGIRSCNANTPWEIKVDPLDTSYYAERRIWLGLVEEQVPAKRQGDNWYIFVDGKWKILYFDMNFASDGYHGFGYGPQARP